MNKLIKMERREKIVFLALGLLFISYFIAKAFTVPITHDESGSCLYYSSLPVKSILKYDNPWPTNHILNTLAVKLTTFLFGLTQFTGRLPNLLTSLLFLFFTYKIARLISSSFLVSVTVFLIFLANPYMNDFFSLARGYGMAVAFMTGSLYFFLSFLRHRSYKYMALTMTFALLTVAANFSFLIYIASLNALIFFISFSSFLRKKTPLAFFLRILAIVFLFDLVIGAFSYYPVTRMNATNQFQFWGNEGFYRETFLSLFHSFSFGITYFNGQYDSFAKVLVAIILLMLLIGIVFLTYKKEEANFKFTVYSISSILLLLTVAINLIQHKLLGTPYLASRTALLYMPLLALVTGSGLSLLQYYFKKVSTVVSFALIAIISIHLINCYTLKYIKEWQFDQNTFEVLDRLKKIKDERNSPEPIRLNTQWLFTPSINFYKQTQDLTWLDLAPYHKEPQYDQQDEFYYTLAEEYNLVPGSYEKILTFDNDARALFQFSSKPVTLIDSSADDSATYGQLYFFNTIESSYAWSDFHAANVIRSASAHSGNYVCKVDSGNPYSLTFTMTLSDVSRKTLKAVNISAWVNLSSMGSNPLLVAELRNRSQKTIEWLSTNAKQTVNTANTWKQIFLTINLDEKERNNPSNSLRVYVTNGEKDFSLVDDIEIRFEEK